MVIEIQGVMWLILVLISCGTILFTVISVINILIDDTDDKDEDNDYDYDDDNDYDYDDNLIIQVVLVLNSLIDSFKTPGHSIIRMVHLHW